MYNNSESQNRFLIYLQHQIILLGSNSDDDIQLTHNQKKYLSNQLVKEIEAKIITIKDNNNYDSEF